MSLLTGRFSRGRARTTEKHNLAVRLCSGEQSPNASTHTEHRDALDVTEAPKQISQATDKGKTGDQQSICSRRRPTLLRACGVGDYGACARMWVQVDEMRGGSRRSSFIAQGAAAPTGYYAPERGVRLQLRGGRFCRAMKLEKTELTRRDHLTVTERA